MNSIVCKQEQFIVLKEQEEQLIVQEERTVVEVEHAEVEYVADIVSADAQTSTVEIGVMGPQGPPGPQGPMGPQGPPSMTYIHDQQVAAKTWELVHDLGSHPSVTVVDSSGRYVIGDVQYIDKNTILISFSAGFAGKAYLNV